MESCSFRKTTPLGSSKYMDRRVPFLGILSSQPSDNPDFFNRNKVKIRYFDGASFTGRPENEPKALLSGCSAGGLATLIHCDDFRSLLPRDTTVKFLADAGIYVQFWHISLRFSIWHARIYKFSTEVLPMFLMGIKKSKICMQRADESAVFRMKMRCVEPKIQRLLAEYGIPRKLESKVKRVVKARLKNDQDLMVENMFSIISSDLVDGDKFANDLAIEIKCCLFTDKLNKVDGLKDKGEEVLKSLCELLEPMIYDKECYIIQEGEPLTMMFFVTIGDVLTFSTNKGGSNGPSSTIQYEKDRDGLYGEELLTWAKGSSRKLSSLPIAVTTIKSYNKVEVFALKANDLKWAVSEFPNHFNMDTTLTIAVHNEM